MTSSNSKIKLTSDESGGTKRCLNCGVDITCGVTQAGESCWCMAYPAIMPLELQQDCLCADCLAKTVSEKIDQFIDITPLKEVINVASRYRDNQSLIENIDYTIENGNYVFSRWYHLKRGSCCGNQCRNCPYTSQP